MYGCGKDCLILTPFRLPQISCFTLSLKCFSSDSVAPLWGSDPRFSPPPAQGRSGPANTPVFPPSSFVLPSFAWFCVFFSAGQVLLSAVRWCAACTSVSEGVFLVYPWRRDGLHVHLLLRHLVLSLFLDFLSKKHRYRKLDTRNSLIL